MSTTAPLISIRVLASRPNVVCPSCRDRVDGADASCEHCGAVFHIDCVSTDGTARRPCGCEATRREVDAARAAERLDLIETLRSWRDGAPPSWDAVAELRDSAADACLIPRSYCERGRESLVWAIHGSWHAEASGHSPVYVLDPGDLAPLTPATVEEADEPPLFASTRAVDAAAERIAAAAVHWIIAWALDAPGVGPRIPYGVDVDDLAAQLESAPGTTTVYYVAGRLAARWAMAELPEGCVPVNAEELAVELAACADDAAVDGFVATLCRAGILAWADRRRATDLCIFLRRVNGPDWPEGWRQHVGRLADFASWREGEAAGFFLSVAVADAITQDD